MAKENVKKFIEEVSKNKELQEKFLAAQEGYKAEGKTEEEVLEDIVIPMAKETGCEFTVSEYRAAHRDAVIEKGISEEELENVSGGGNWCYFVGFGTEPSAGASGINDFHACCFIGIGTDFMN